MTTASIHGYRWRALTPQQEAAIRAACDAGVRAADLAREYGVCVRTVYRARERAAVERFAEVVLDGWRATFSLTEEGPVCLTCWTPA